MLNVNSKLFVRIKILNAIKSINIFFSNLFMYINYVLFCLLQVSVKTL